MVRQRSAKPLFIGSIPIAASNVMVRWWIAGISGALSALAIMYAAGQVKTQVRRRWFVIGATLLVVFISILVFPRLVGE